jgi:hypothetical protein
LTEQGFNAYLTWLNLYKTGRRQAGYKEEYPQKTGYFTKSGKVRISFGNGCAYDDGKNAQEK